MQLHRSRRHALTEDEVDEAVFHGRIEDLFAVALQAMDFVDKEDVALFEKCEDASQIARLG